MTLPSFRSLGARRDAEKHQTPDTESTADDGVTTERSTMPSGTVDIKRATKTRRAAIITASFLLSISVIFLVLVRPLLYIATQLPY
jgi:hypothetical protein